MAITIALVALFVSAVAARAQSNGSLTGQVRDAGGVGIAQALVTVSPLGSSSGQETITSATGSFLISFVVPGSYEVRVESVGYRPLVARVLTISAGEQRNLDLRLTLEPPPVLSVDTLVLGPSSSTRWRPGAVHLGEHEAGSLPHRFEDLASVAALATAFDESFGSQGLPGEMTLIIADGLPYYRAPHPTARAEAIPDALFPRSSLAGVTAFHDATDSEWTGAAGGYLSVATRASTPGQGIEVDGAASADPLWSSNKLDFDTPSLTSYQGGARGTVDLRPDAARLVVSGEVLRQDTPLAPRLSSTLATDLGMLDPDLLGTLTGPAVESYSRYSGMARVDVQNSPTGRFFIRGAGSYAAREFEGTGPVSLARAIAVEEQSTAFSVAAGMVRETSRSTILELKAGFSGNYRDFDPAVAGVSPGSLVETATPLGVLPSAWGTSSRLDFVFVPVLSFSPGETEWRFGGTARASNHTLSHSTSPQGDLLFSDPAALLAGRGFGRSTSAPETSFPTSEFGVFASVERALGPDVTVKLGGRFDYESVSGDGAALEPDWLTVSGLSNDVYPDAFMQIGAGGAITWAPDGASTRIHATGSLHHGDVDTRVYHEVLAGGLGATTTTFAGSGLDWPGGEPLPSTGLPTLTLLGPDTRAPRTVNLGVGIAQGLGQQATIFLRSSVRRTDFLMRRRNLNLPTVAQATDPNGRAVLGTLAQDGSLVTTTADDARRFVEFGEVWSLDPDGWSEYLGLTVGLEQKSRSVELYASYTYSETTDNWVGASSGSIGTALSPALPDTEADWSEGTSDYDVPHRAAAGLTLDMGPAAISAAYHFRSGLPFTPGYRRGVDANGDGSIENDVAFVPGDARIAALLDSWPCLDGQTDGFAVRNSCRSGNTHSVDVRVQIALGAFGGRVARLTVDGLNLVETSGGVVDRALLRVDPTGMITTSPDGSTVTIPTTVNPDFGQILYPSTRGRMLRLGVRIGA